MSIIVQKFGGTSVSTTEKRQLAIDKVLACYNKGNQVVVVVSAMGRKGAPYATDTLRSLILDHYPNCSLELLDFLMSCGEMISAVTFAAELESKGYNAVPLMGFQAGIKTDNNYSNADILSIDTEYINEYLEKNYIVVVTGFQGICTDKKITTLGRGGSDTTATALGMALKANVVEIYTDVDGIMTADPNVVSKAKTISTINYDEIFQMADKGAKVIHPRAVEFAQKGNIPLKIKNAQTNHPGTLIHSKEKEIYLKQDRLLTAITQKDDISQITVLCNDTLSEDVALFSAISNNHISIDMINLLQDKKIFTIDCKQEFSLIEILDNLQLNYKISKAFSKVTIIGNRMMGIPGVMAKVVSALGKNNIKIYQTSDSHLTISCLVKTEHAQKAVNILHDAFDLCK
ncbi:aspartate kinase [Serpentinicella sp. ANB-PHB4]|uniref:aspartate kinase n=1 Tax=Serpentinicella sp. ANB-PHB4 TaxID=3074076 RepID=UPI0028593DCE|nr:aspartate kinase [Serpentinicella sp. ANB-PHB4]MDR5658600.1 aspartate kinase [Serpentinicella sp. ANB-PHB4]